MAQEVTFGTDPCKEDEMIASSPVEHRDPPGLPIGPVRRK
jgi:hypothetical protein